LDQALSPDPWLRFLPKELVLEKGVFPAGGAGCIMAAPSIWRGYLKLSLVSCAVALDSTTTSRDRIHILNRKRGPAKRLERAG
jgi:hypothetical protein